MPVKRGGARIENPTACSCHTAVARACNENILPLHISSSRSNLISCPNNDPAVFYQGVLWRSAEPCVAWRRHIYPKSPTVSGGLFCRLRATTLQWPYELSRGRR